MLKARLSCFTFCKLSASFLHEQPIGSLQEVDTKGSLWKSAVPCFSPGKVVKVDKMSTSSYVPAMWKQYTTNLESQW